MKPIVLHPSARCLLSGTIVIVSTKFLLEFSVFSQLERNKNVCGCTNIRTWTKSGLLYTATPLELNCHGHT